MERHRLINESDFQSLLDSIKGDSDIHLDFINDGQTEPVKYPCMAIMSYSSPGYCKICFIYPEDIYFSILLYEKGDLNGDK